MAWLVRAGDVLAVAEVAESLRDRSRGLLGRDGIEGAIVLRPARQVHSLGMRFAIDVAFCDRSGAVLRTTTLRPWRVSRPVLRARFVVEAASGAFERWSLRPGDVLEVRS